jgi:aryl-alcohol dehydrogenase-like predicted oxidoreductase
MAPIEETLRAMDDLVTSGKLRYLGISDVPAWKVAQAQTIAHFRGWESMIALQVEYSLLARTVEGELTPMAQELGLGVMPWGPLRGGKLSGKYTRENAGKLISDRTGSAVGPTEAEFVIIDAVNEVAVELGCGNPTETTPMRGEPFCPPSRTVATIWRPTPAPERIFWNNRT